MKKGLNIKPPFDITSCAPWFIGYRKSAAVFLVFVITILVSGMHVAYAQSHRAEFKQVGLSRDSLSRIKAVLVVGPAEGTTKETIEQIHEIALYLRKLGVKVTELYEPAATWRSVVIASAGAHIFLYSGHGTSLGEIGTTGGFYLSGGDFISAATISKELKLHKNALVIFKSVCMGAGSSASDNSDIGIKVAIQRVSDYAYSFIKHGAGGYYANNYNNSIVPFLEAFFNRKSLKDAYKTTTGAFCRIEKTEVYMYKPDCRVSVASSEGSGYATRTSVINGVKKVEKVPSFKEYEIAYVGNPSFSVIDFFR